MGIAVMVGCSAMAQMALKATGSGAAQLPQVAEHPKLTPAQIAEREERILKKTGGFIEVQPSGPALLLVDAQSMTTGAVARVADRFAALVRMPVRILRDPKAGDNPLAFGLDALKSNKTVALVVVVAEESHASVLTVYPEERVASVNVRRLTGGTDATGVEIRTIKEMWRAIGMLTGTGYSMQKECVMQPVFTAEDLDKNAWQFISPNNYIKMQKIFDQLGMKRGRRVPYRLACLEGWAATPTNAYQTAIWNEVKEQKKSEATQKK